MSALCQLVYTSTALEPFDKTELMALLEDNARRNAQSGITGLLLYKDGCFMHALEGDEDAVTALFAKISHDPRHHHIIPLIHERVEQREFPDSAMAFPDSESAELRDLPGYSQFLNTPPADEWRSKELSKCQKLLLLFKQSMQ